MQSRSLIVSSRRILATVAVMLLAMMLPVSAASAHDSVTGTSPEDGQTLEEVPEAIELTFTDTPVALGSQVIVEGADGTDWAVGEPEIVDNVVSQPISSEAPAGQYTVTWRVVSSDSHPIEGVFQFTANAGGAGGAESSAPESVESEAAAVEEPETEQSGSAFPTSFVIVLSALLVALVIFMVVLARRRLRKSDDVG